MNLTIEHLAKRLPSGLQMYTPWDFPKCSPIIGIVGSTIILRMDDGEIADSINLDYEGDGRSLPILRPISDLTKSIKHKGEEFVPIEKLNNDGEVVFQSDLLFYPADGMREIHLDEFKDIFNKLLSWHFDTDGLIAAGLAIDVNTLPQNPYA